MHGKLIGFLICVALLGFPCVGMSNEDNKEQQLTPDEPVNKLQLQLRECLSTGKSWNECSEEVELQKVLQFDIPESAFSDKAKKMVESEQQHRKDERLKNLFGGLWAPSPIERLTHKPHIS